MPSKKKKYNARFPPARIKKIMQTDEDVGKVAAAVPVIISRALELFVESLLTKAVQVTTARNAKTLSPNHLKLCILAEGRFDFLKDLVMSIPDVQVEGEEVGGVGMLPTPTATHSPQVFRSQSHSEEGAGTLMPPSSSRGRRPRGRPRKNPLAAPRAPTTKNAKSTTDSDETESAESDASDEDEDLSTDTDSATRGSKHPVASKSGREAVLSPQSQLQFNAVQPNFYQEINSTSAPFQIRISLPAQEHESKVAVNGQSKVPDAAVDDDYDT